MPPPRVAAAAAAPSTEEPKPASDDDQKLSSRERIIMWACIVSCSLAIGSFTMIKWDVEARLSKLPEAERERWLKGEQQPGVR